MGLFDRLKKPKTIDAPPPMPQQCILVVSDDAQTAAQVRQNLVENGYDVCSASTPTEAIDILKTSTHVDLMIGDFRNPETDGKTFLVSVRARLGTRSVPPVVFLMDTESDEIVAGQMGVSEVISKPVEPDALLAVVRSRAVQRTT